MNLLEYLSKVSDFRRKQGQRYPLDAVITIQVLAIMSGCISNRSIARFAKNHQEDLTEMLGLKHGVPSHVTFREVSLHIDIASVQEQFNAWAARLFTADEFASLQQRIIAFDGKSLRATMNEYSSEHQDFVCFLHAFAVETGLILHAEQYHNGHQSEISVLQQVLGKLAIRGAIFTTDAIHTQKKR